MTWVQTVFINYQQKKLAVKELLLPLLAENVVP